MKLRIKELKIQSLKLKKKDLNQKAEKKKIAHQIKELTEKLNHDGAVSESDEAE